MYHLLDFISFSFDVAVLFISWYATLGRVLDECWCTDKLAWKMYPLLLTCTEESVPKCTNLYNMHVLPNRECPLPGTALWFLAANIFQPIRGQHCLTSGRYAQRNQSLYPKIPRNSRSTATDSDKNVMIPVRDCVQTIKRPNCAIEFLLILWMI